MEDYMDLRQRYASLDNDELTELACYGAWTLRPEARDLLKAEIRFRGLHLDVEKGMEVQLEAFTAEQLGGLVARFRRLPCPLCGGEGGPLNAFPVVEVRSFLGTKRKERLVVGCAPCIESEATRSRRVSLLWGWWGFWGWILTIEALGVSRRAQGAGEHPEPTRQLVEFVRQNRGYLTAVTEAPPAVIVPLPLHWQELVN